MVNNRAWLYNDTEAPLKRSKWVRQLFAQIDTISSTQSINFPANKSYNGASYRALLRKNCKIDIDYQTEFDGSQANMPSWIVEQNSGTISAPLTYNTGNINYNFAGWEDNLTAPANRTIWPVDNGTYTALYKYPFHSNKTTTFQNTSQRKYIRAHSGEMYMVYESMDRIWLECSTDGGNTWSLLNGGKPVSARKAKNPSAAQNGQSEIIGL